MKTRATRFALALLVGAALTACEDPGVLQPDSERSTELAEVDSQSAVKGSCDVLVPADHASIQGAVDAAAPGDQVCVEAAGGPYREQVVVNKDLSLRGVDGPVIEAPADPADFTIPESGPTWEPIVFAFGGTAPGGAVSGAGVVEVDVTGFEVDGRDRQPNGRGVGIFYRNAEGSISGNDVHSMGVGGRETMGILAYGDSDVTIAGNAVSEYERGGIGANGDGGVHPSPDAEIVDNVVSTPVQPGVAWAPNGIQVGFGATGKVSGNEVTGNRWHAPSWTASCILVFESDDVQVQDNQVSDCDAGVSVGAWAWFAPSADNTKITGNVVEDAGAGIVLQPVAFDGLSTTDPSVSNAKVVGNELVGGDLGDSGVVIGPFDMDPDYDPVADNNKLINNTISGFDDAVVDQGVDSKSSANAIEP